MFFSTWMVIIVTFRFLMALMRLKSLYNLSNFKNNLSQFFMFSPRRTRLHCLFFLIACLLKMLPAAHHKQEGQKIWRSSRTHFFIPMSLVQLPAKAIIIPLVIDYFSYLEEVGTRQWEGFHFHELNLIAEFHELNLFPTQDWEEQGAIIRLHVFIRHYYFA